MNTEKTNKPVSQLYFVEKGTWKNGQEVITVYFKNEQGKAIAVGHTYVFYEKDSKMEFRSQDSKGNELFPPCNNRYDLKKQYLDNEQELIQKNEKKQEIEQEKNPAPQNPQQANQPEQVQQPANAPEKKQKPERKNRRKNELSDIRQEKDNHEKEQTINH